MPLSQPQQTIVNAPQRFKVVVAGRRFGKTYLANRQLCYHARLANQTVWYVAPSYRQAKMIAFKSLKRRLLDLRWVSKINETELTFTLKNNSTISLKGADNYDSLRGVGLSFLVLDEFADIAPDAWYETLRPTLSDTMAPALFIGTPKGLNWAHDLYSLSLEYPDEWASFQFTTIQGGNVKLEEILAAQRTLDPKTYRQEYEATFENFAGRIYYAFERQQNLRRFEHPIPNEIFIGMDFNVARMMACIGAKIRDNGKEYFHVFDEIAIPEANTDDMVQEIKNRFPKNQITVLPDASGQARKTSAGGRTDHTILRNAGFRVLAPASHNAVKDGINAVNAKLKSSAGITTLFIDPRCKYTIESLEKFTWKEGTNIPDKESGFDHMGDALRYMIDYLYPIRRDTQPIKPQMWGHKVARH
jgi:hypothetical protein